MRVGSTRAPALNVTLINNYWSIDAGILQAGAHSVRGGTSRHLVLINERIAGASARDLSGRLNCHVILVNRGIPTVVVQLPDEVASRFVRGIHAFRASWNCDFFFLPRRRAPLRTDNETRGEETEEKSPARERALSYYRER